MNGKPDFYGPFWLLTTIVFLVSSTGNLSRYFYNWTKDAYIFKLELVRYAVLVVYSFGFGVPAILYFVMKFFGSKLSLPEVILEYMLDNLPIRILIQLLHPNLPTMHNPNPSNPMATNLLRHDKHIPVPNLQPERPPGLNRAPKKIPNFWPDSRCSNCPLFDF